jgi:hypothetical protein
MSKRNKKKRSQFIGKKIDLIDFIKKHILESPKYVIYFIIIIIGCGINYLIECGINYLIECGINYLLDVNCENNYLIYMQN